MNKPIIAVTLGDPTGVGPEITVKALSQSSLYDICLPFVIGSPVALQLACDLVGCDWRVVEISSPEELTLNQFSSTSPPNQLFILPVGPNNWGTSIKPVVDSRGGEAAYAALVKSTELALSGDVAAIVTSPLHKVALYEAGHDWPGHTELLAHLCGVQEHAMMLYLPPRVEELPVASTENSNSIAIASDRPRSHGGPAGLGVVHVTLHMALREVFDLVTEENILEKIELAQQVFSRIKTSLNLPGAPRIAVTALNPHAGEGGRFGDEESRIIRPAVEKAQTLGLNAVGPLAVDTLMPKAAAGEYDAVVAMYHDQGHIALKLLDMFDAVNITLGLPIVRTSVAHGTAHDIAWKNQSKESGMVQAILTAARLQGIANNGQGPANVG